MGQVVEGVVKKVGKGGGAVVLSTGKEVGEAKVSVFIYIFMFIYLFFIFSNYNFFFFFFFFFYFNLLTFP